MIWASASAIADLVGWVEERNPTLTIYKRIDNYKLTLQIFLYIFTLNQHNILILFTHTPNRLEILTSYQQYSIDNILVR